MNKSLFFKKTKKISAFLLSVICAAASFGVFAVDSLAIATEKNEDNYSYYLYENFEASASQFPFGAEIKNGGMSYIGPDSLLRTEDWNVLSGNLSLEIKKCDIRWWSMSVYADEIFVGFEFESLTDDYGNTMQYCINTQDPATATEGTGGMVIKIQPDSNGKPAVKNKNNETVTTLENKTPYSFILSFKRGSDKYDIYINNIPYKDNSLGNKFYSVLGQRITSSEKEDSSFILDNLSIFTQKKYKQSFSAQEQIKEPNVKIPDYVEQDYTKLFLNDTEIRLSAPVLSEDGTQYIPLGDFVKAMGGTVSEKGGKISITVGDFTAEVSIGSKEGTSDGKSVSFNTAPKKSGKTIYMPLNAVNTVFGMKVWYDETGDMIVISNKKYATDNILRVLNTRFYMNGQPYYEISFNKFDLVYQIAPDYFGYTSSYPSEKFTYAAAENALKELAANGFKTIRFFCICGDGDVLYDEAKKETYFKIMDSVFDLLDKYNIQATVDLCTISDQFLAREYDPDFGWVQKTETTTDLVADPNCESRKFLYSYLEEFIARYKDRHAVLMWEIQNEAALGADIGQGRAPGYSLLQLGKYYEDIVKKIKSIDPDHLVSSGDACLRSSQYHLFLATISGENNDWTPDSAEQRLKALQILDYGVDVISAHTYSWGTAGTDCDTYDEDGNTIHMDFTYIMNEANRLGKAYYSGEFGGTDPYSPDMPITDSDIAAIQTNLMNNVIEQGVQLTHWWTFESHRQGFGDDTTWNVSLKRHRFTFDAIAEANRKLQDKYVVNGASADNTAEAVSELTVSDSYKASTQKNTLKTVIITAICVIAAAAIACCVTVVLKRKKKSA